MNTPDTRCTDPCTGGFRPYTLYDPYTRYMSPAHTPCTETYTACTRTPPVRTRGPLKGGPVVRGPEISNQINQQRKQK